MKKVYSDEKAAAEGLLFESMFACPNRLLVTRSDGQQPFSRSLSPTLGEAAVRAKVQDLCRRFPIYGADHA